MSTIHSLLGPIPGSLGSGASTLSNIIAVACVIPYCLAIWRRKVTPPPATWAIWAVAGIVGAAGIAMAGGPFASWSLKLALSVGPAAVAVVALRRGIPWATTRTDRVCLILSGVGIVFLLFGEGIPALIVSILVNIIGSVPTVAHAWRRPFNDTYFPFACAFVSVSAVLATIPWPWTFASSAYGLYLLVDTGVIMATIAIARARMTRRIARSRRWLVLVTPDADEAERVDHDQVAAGLAWLEEGQATGYLTEVDSLAAADGRPLTGGYMIVVADDLEALDARLATYPLLDTIREGLDVRPLNRRLGDGFEVLHADVATAGAHATAPVRDRAR